jgi:multiple sugar transport system ATP-binding protein
MAEITLSSVEKHYGAMRVVHGIDLDIAHEEFVVLVGPSGCGKSTTLRMIAGLEEITGGEIRIGGRVVNDLPPRKRNISMVFQNYALYPHMNVRDNLGFGLKIAGQQPQVIASRVNEAAEILGLTSLLDRTPAELSGGQRQRVAMGRAIVRHPDAFLFDEPLSNLDAKLRGQMRAEIKKLHRTVQDDRRLRHPRPGRGDDARRPHRRHAGRPHRAGRHSLEVFGNPRPPFVATFIGSPPMNLLPGSVSGSGRSACRRHGPVPVPPPLARSPTEGTEVLLGIRLTTSAPWATAFRRRPQRQLPLT